MQSVPPPMNILSITLGKGDRERLKIPPRPWAPLRAHDTLPDSSQICSCSRLAHGRLVLGFSRFPGPQLTQPCLLGLALLRQACFAAVIPVAPAVFPVSRSHTCSQEPTRKALLGCPSDEFVVRGKGQWVVSVWKRTSLFFPQLLPLGQTLGG